MAIVTPAGFLQNAGAVHTAEVTRNAIGFGASLGRLAASPSMKPRGGVHFEAGVGFIVAQNTVPDMSVNVLEGAAYVPGTEGSKQGLYSVINDAPVNLAIGASHATLNRIDIVVVKVQDTAYSGAVNAPSLAVVVGTPAASPSAPAAPANSIILAQVSIPATVTTITTARIADQRPILAGPGGIIRCNSYSRPATTQVDNGQMIYEMDTAKYRALIGGAWQGLPHFNDQRSVQKTTLSSGTTAPANTTKQNTSLTFYGDAGEWFSGYACIFCDGGAIGDISFDTTGPSGYALTMVAIESLNGSAAAATDATYMGASTTFSGLSGGTFGGSGNPLGLRIWMTFQMGGNSGPVTLRFSQQSNDTGTATRVLAGSFMHMGRSS